MEKRVPGVMERNSSLKKTLQRAAHHDIIILVKVSCLSFLLSFRIVMNDTFRMQD